MYVPLDNHDLTRNSFTSQELKAQILALQQLVEELPPGSVQEVYDDLAMAAKAIVQAPRLPAKQTKPHLNEEDLD
jgi:hypothetical protein